MVHDSLGRPSAPSQGSSAAPRSWCRPPPGPTQTPLRFLNNHDLNHFAFPTILRGFPHGLHKGVSNLEAELWAEKFDQPRIFASIPLPGTLAQICLALTGRAEEAVDDCVQQVLVRRVQKHLLKAVEGGSPVLPAGDKPLKQVSSILS